MPMGNSFRRVCCLIIACEKGFALPRRIEIQQGEDVILIQVKSRAINTGLTDEDFVLPVPRDAIRQ